MKDFLSKYALLLLAFLSLILLMLSINNYYPIGYFTNRWVYFVLFVLLLVKTFFKIIQSLDKAFTKFIVGIILLVSILMTPMMIFFPYFFMVSMGWDYEVLYQGKGYKIIQLEDLPMSGGQPDYAVFKKCTIGWEKVFESSGYIKRQSPSIIIKNKTPYLVKGNELVEGKMDTILLVRNK